MRAKGGVKEAAKLLAGLDAKGRKVVLEKIALKDPKMAAELEKNLVVFEDLQYLNAKMLQDLLKEIERDDLGRALRAASTELKNFFLKTLPSSIKNDIEQILLGPPLSMNKIEESTEKIMRVVRDKVDKGIFVLKPDSDDEEYV